MQFKASESVAMFARTVQRTLTGTDGRYRLIQELYLRDEDARVRAIQDTDDPKVVDELLAKKMPFRIMMDAIEPELTAAETWITGEMEDGVLGKAGMVYEYTPTNYHGVLQLEGEHPDTIKQLEEAEKYGREYLEEVLPALTADEILQVTCWVSDFRKKAIDILGEKAANELFKRAGGSALGSGSYVRDLAR